MNDELSAQDAQAQPPAPCIRHFVLLGKVQIGIVGGVVAHLPPVEPGVNGTVAAADLRGMPLAVLHPFGALHGGWVSVAVSAAANPPERGHRIAEAANCPEECFGTANDAVIQAVFAADAG